MAQGRKKLIDELKSRAFTYRDFLTGDGVRGTWRGASCNTSFVDVIVRERRVEAWACLTDEKKWQFLWSVDEGQEPIVADGYLSELLEREMPWEEGK